MDSTINGLISDNTDEIGALDDRVTANEAAISTAEDEIDALEDAVAALEDAGLIESYFFVNDDAPKEFARSTEERDLIDEFCVSESGVLIVNLAVTYRSLDT